MSLPPGFLDELRTRVSLSSVIGRKVTWDMRKSNQGKGDFWAPCPFHQEKSASFHVDDRKGFYYCFGCQAKGDAVTFVKESENVSFMEAVEILAREAGMAMPARDPRAAEKADRRSLLAEVMEEAVKWFRLQLKTAQAAEARAYLDRRRLPPPAQDRWDIGWAPDTRQGLFHALTQKGIAPDLIVDAGLCIRPDDGGQPYDRFRGRIMFPIRDARGRCISFGGRSLDPNARAKYLNGPETELFDKGRNLFNLAPAREAAGKGQPLIVAEGYMDVIALSEAGFRAAVAPLGTAVTEDQLRLMWRLHPEPVITLDGDAAGQRAAMRVMDLALPLLEAGQGLRFAILPQGLDPDDLIKAQGAPAMQKVLDEAQPMVNLLWRRETEGRVFDSPERKAALDKTLRAALMRIKDPSIRAHYGEDIKALRWDLFRQGRKPVRKPGQTPAFGATPGWRARAALPEAPVATTRASLLARADEPATVRLRSSIVLATLCLFPQFIDRFEGEVERLRLSDEDHETLRQVILSHAYDPHPETRAARIAEAAGPSLDSLLADPHLILQPHVRNRGDADSAEKCLEIEFNKLRAHWGAEQELREAEEDITGVVDEGLTWRVSQATQARLLAEKGPEDARTEGVLAPNGVEMDRDELEYQRKSFSSIDFTRGGKARQ